MTKIPVWETVNAGYNFMFGNLIAIVGLIWLPVALTIGLHYLQSTIGGDGSTSMGAADFVRGLAYFLGTVLLNAIIYQAVSEQALGMRQGRPFVHIALGLPEFRMAGALLVYLVLLLFMFMLVVGVTYATNFVIRSVGGAAAGLLTAAAVQLAGFAFILFTMVRISFLLSIVVAAEKRVSMERVWILSQGNFWRIMGCLVLLLLPVAALWLFGFSAVLAEDMAPLQQKAAINPEDPALQAAFSKVLEAHSFHAVALLMLLSPLYLGLSLGAAAHAYRVLTRGLDRPMIEGV